MLTNAKILRVDPVASVSPGGEIMFTTGPDVSVDCSLDQVSSALRYQLGATIKEATQVLRVETDEIPAGMSIDNGYRMVTQLDGYSSRTQRVEYWRPFVNDVVSHVEIFLRDE